MKRIILSATLVALTVAMLALSSLASGAQEDGGQYASDEAQQYVPSTTPTTTTAPQSTVICAPWSKAWDLSQGQWYYDWYRWCVDPAVYDPSIESSWYTETAGSEWGEVANLCPEKGTCTMSPDGGMRMSTSTNPSDVTEPLTTTISSSPTPTTTPTPTTAPEDTQTPTTTTPPTTTTTTPSATPTPTTAPEDTQTPTTAP